MNTWQRSGVVAFLSVFLAAPTNAASPPVVGWLVLVEPPPVAPHILAGLKDLGHEIGRTLLIERRSADGDNSRFPALARELLESRPAVVLSPCGFAQRAIREVSRTVPVVSLCADEKNFLGEVKSLRRPGGATTGVTLLAPESAAKRLEILRDIRPDLKRVAFLYQSDEDWESYWREIERVAPGLDLTVLRLPIKHADDLDAAFAAALRERVDALIAFPDATTFGVAKRIAQFALKHRLPTAFDFALFAEAGGLVSYSADLGDLMRRVVPRYIDMILKGAKPGDLPVVQPTKFDLVINLKTARALGLTIPPSLLLRADRVIE